MLSSMWRSSCAEHELDACVSAEEFTRIWDNLRACTRVRTESLLVLDLLLGQPERSADAAERANAHVM